MKIAFFIEGNLNNPGGYNQIISTASFVKNSLNEENNIIFITNSNELKQSLQKVEINSINYKKSIPEKILDYIFGLLNFFRIFIYFNLKHSFSKFLKKNNIDLVIFLSPTEYALFCDDINFVINIWDLDHKKNSPFPEHKRNYTFEKREEFLNNILFKSFKIIVAHKGNKQDLVRFYNCEEEKIIVQPFIPLLPNITNNKIGFLSEHEKNELLKFTPKKKLIIYPATFWAHKNHKYILEAAEILLSEKHQEFHFIFCGVDRGNYDYIKDTINKKNLNKSISVFSLVSNIFLKNLYEKCFAVIMPTDAGPTNLPLYESMYFNKPIFYSEKISYDDELKNIIIPINLSDPSNFVLQLKNLKDNEIKKKIKNGKIYYEKYCLEKNIYLTYKSIIDQFANVAKTWKNN